MTTDPKHLTEAQAATEAARLIREAYRQEAEVLPAPTSFRDDSPVPTVGTTPPVPQPDSRIVPQWAAGVAVASIGVGAGVTGLGCGAWLVLQGLSSVTLLGVLAIAAPFAGIAMVATAIGAAVSRAKSASTTNIYRGSVVQKTEITSTARGMLSRSNVGR
ncbi:hypothetical protein [Streptomyces sp. FL07-04A]|uniref:hypothetical protein n=1 Tax=Streptomyces sp. FL07-04A TaxID=3028658 RepID=UPI0029ADDBAB|nr:hypothetical protein [Streptomyces sp. FL07-04A]MDX3579952.1 hypothetical protein [Streptomyces sp. FL07-04A]